MASERSSRQRSASSSSKSMPRSRSDSIQVQDITDGSSFVPVAATASHVIYAHGKDIVCLHHDTLAVDRTFGKHKSPIRLLAVDNVSERGAGHLVASYDADQVAIIWDLFTGSELTRFSSFKRITVAAWMRNGHISFGNEQGEIILFEPEISEHKSLRTIHDSISAIAPASDCQTAAIGYNNGSVLIAQIVPTFSILHTISTSAIPSMIQGLAWHAASKLDMLAIQSASGDLRVWNVAKPASAEIPRPIRTLDRGGDSDLSLNWIAWSKNGRIVQYSKGEILVWDVRTRQVAYIPVLTTELVRGITNYGPSAVLFTLSPEFSIQQYDLTLGQQEEVPAMFTLTKSIKHDISAMSSTHSTPKLSSSAVLGAAPPVFRGLEPHRGPSTLSTIQRATVDPTEHARMLRTNMTSPGSGRNGTIDSRSVESRSSNGRSTGRRDRAPSIVSYGANGTEFSATMSPSFISRDTAPSPFWPQTASATSSSRRSKASRLRHEVPLTPEGNLVDLFPYTRARLASLPYQPGNSTLDVKTAPAKELRLQMLRIVFGWHEDIEHMIRDEITRHAAESWSATLLSKWLGEVETNYMNMLGNDSVTGNDWRLLALAAISSQGQAASVLGRGFAQKLLQQGDIHTAATILLGIKALDEAVTIYLNRNYFMEAIILTTLLFPEDWQRQSNLVRRWGDYVVENSQQHLAIRCFTVTGADTSIPWASPTQSPFEGVTGPRTMHALEPSPPGSPETEANQQTRMTLKSSSLKLITTFPSQKTSTFLYPGLKNDDRTPTNQVAITPIAESAMSPSGTPSTCQRNNAMWPRSPSTCQRNNAMWPRSPATERKNRLSSIDETTRDTTSSTAQEEKASLSTSEVELDSDDKEQLLKPVQYTTPKLSIDTTKVDHTTLTLPSATYDPREAETTPKVTPQTAIPNSAIKNKLYSNSEINAINSARDGSRARAGSRDRKPTGLHIQMPTLEQINLNAIATGADGLTPIKRKQSTDSSSVSDSLGRRDFVSPLTTGQSWTSSAKSPSVSGRSTDKYISSVEEAKHRAHQQKAKREHRSELKSSSKGRGRLPSEDRGRSGQRPIRPAKRSPSSPKPMSPADLQLYRSQHTPSVDSVVSRDSSPDDVPRTHSAKRKGRSTSKLSDTSHISRATARRFSPEPPVPERRSRSRQPEQSRLLSPIEDRGRSRSRAAGSLMRSPSSPLPMSDQAKLYRSTADDYIDSDPLKLVEANRQRLRSQPRSSSRKPRERGASVKREQSNDRLRRTEDQPHPPQISHLPQMISDSHRVSDQEKTNSDVASEGGLRRTKSHRTLKRDAAARELEARRESIIAKTAMSIPPPASRPTAPERTASDSTTMYSTITLSPDMYQEPIHYFDPVDRAKSAGPYGNQTPRAMRHTRRASRDDSIPSVPEVPIKWSPTGHPMQEPPRSMSVPMNSIQSQSIPQEVPVHRAFNRQIRPSASGSLGANINPRNSNFPALNEIGRHRRVPSLGGTTASNQLASIGEALHNITDVKIIDVPESDHNSQGVIPELQHLAMPPPPPPAPSGPPPTEARLSFSTSSGLGVGSIAIVMADDSPTGPPVIENASSGLFPTRAGYTEEARLKTTSPPLPPLPHSGNSFTSTNYGSATSPPPSESGKSHRRGRGSISEVSSKFSRMTDRMRSTSRPRNASKVRTPQPVSAMEKPLPVPYETKVGSGTSYF